MNRIHLGHVFHVISIGVLIEALFVLTCIPVALIYKEHEVVQLIFAFVFISIIGGTVFVFTKRDVVNISIKDNFLAVVLTWIFISLFGAIPYIITNTIPNFADALFESVSGFTTTGSSILNDIEAMPKSLLFWRAETHWLGGMGVIVLVIALIPYFNIGGQQMMIAEGAFFTTEKIKARTIDVAKRMWFIYVVLTTLEVVALSVCGMNLFDAVCHAFATVATGGFSTYNSSLINSSASIQYVVILFMILSGMNFTLHYMFVHGRFKRFFKDEELKVYAFLILISSLVIAYFIVQKTGITWEPAFRQALFQVSSIITATGFVSADYLYWTPFAKFIILLLMLTGACIGSTGGGIKVARYVIVFKNMRQYLKQIINPNSIQIARFNEQSISLDVTKRIIGFIFFYYTTIAVGSLIMVLTGLDHVSAVSSVITTLGGIGPGFNLVGPVENFASLSEFGKYYLSFNMILGRLEILSVLVFIVPSFYKK
ncbi:MAG: TrkH family potassium uptake protein [Prolixibacteraceae bacterium]|jgi:trk system potassium uptake protein TrkH|nr:TrkH family potassium uptake protein [Prolixibacteraceae bacterium]